MKGAAGYRCKCIPAGPGSQGRFRKAQELFAQRLLLVPRTFLKLFLALSSAWLHLVRLFHRLLHEIKCSGVGCQHDRCNVSLL